MPVLHSFTIPVWLFTNSVRFSACNLITGISNHCTLHCTILCTAFYRYQYNSVLDYSLNASVRVCRVFVKCFAAFALNNLLFPSMETCYFLTCAHIDIQKMLTLFVYLKLAKPLTQILMPSKVTLDAIMEKNCNILM